MSLTTVLSNTTSNNLKSTDTSTLKRASSTADTSTATTGFSDMLAKSSLSTVPSKALGPEALTGTVQSTTVQTSGYTFDPLGVVGIVPESNSFLQAIRQMMGKPLEAPATDTLTTFGALPAATPVLPVAVTASTTNTPTLTSEAAPSGTNPSSVSDFMSTIEAQLNYQVSSTSTAASPTQSAPSNTSVATPTNTYTDLVGQYLAGASAAASVSAESALVNAIEKEPEPA